jgi:hypothetical protein
MRGPGQTSSCAPVDPAPCARILKWAATSALAYRHTRSAPRGPAPPRQPTSAGGVLQGRHLDGERCCLNAGRHQRVRPSRAPLWLASRRSAHGGAGRVYSGHHDRPFAVSLLGYGKRSLHDLGQQDAATCAPARLWRGRGDGRVGGAGSHRHWPTARAQPDQHTGMGLGALARRRPGAQVHRHRGSSDRRVLDALPAGLRRRRTWQRYS